MISYSYRINMTSTQSLNTSTADTGDEKMTSHHKNNIASLEVAVTSLNCELVLLSFDWIITATIIVAMAITLIGNMLVISFICSQKKSRTGQNIALVSICVAAILVACFVIPTHLVISTHTAVPRDQTPMFLCKLHVYVWYWCKTVTIYSICALVCNRFCRVTQANQSYVLSGRYLFFISFIWFFGAAYNIWEIIIQSSALITVTGPDGCNVTIQRCVTSAQFGVIQNGFSTLIC